MVAVLVGVVFLRFFVRLPGHGLLGSSLNEGLVHMFGGPGLGYGRPCMDVVF